MNRYTTIFLTLSLSFLVMTGCTPQTPEVTTSDKPYPLRQDWLVISTPKAAATHWYEPGMPPLEALNIPLEQMNSDQKNLLADKQNNNIVNCRTLSPDDKANFTLAMTKLFGTQAQPAISAVTPEVQDAITGLKLDTETLKHGAAVFENYCVTCHGVTGNGNGTGGKFLIPLPRDYRQGLFKFVSSEPSPFGTKPSRNDLYHTISLGLPGSPMPAFSLTEKDIQAVISQVIYLSIRGECEYKTMAMSIKDGVDDYTQELTGMLKKIAPAWLRSNQNALQIDPDPTVDEDKTVTQEKRLVSAALGYKVFLDGKQGACTTCHVNYGKASPYQYDAWGSIVQPRNLTLGLLRGGREGKDIYARIMDGIQGSGMPSHAHLKPVKGDTSIAGNRVWNLVHFVQILSDKELKQQLQDPVKMKALFKKYQITDDIQVVFD